MSEKLPDGFEARRCPHCERLTVVDTSYDDQRCDWSDTCGELFELADALPFEGTAWWESADGETFYAH